MDQSTSRTLGAVDPASTILSMGERCVDDHMRCTRLCGGHVYTRAGRPYRIIFFSVAVTFPRVGANGSTERDHLEHPHALVTVTQPSSKLRRTSQRRNYQGAPRDEQSTIAATAPDRTGLAELAGMVFAEGQRQSVPAVKRKVAPFKLIVIP